MPPEAYAEHVRRLAAVADRMGALVEELGASHRQHQATTAELRECNRQQLTINAAMRTTLVCPGSKPKRMPRRSWRW
jgi:hypothetical protein